MIKIPCLFVRKFANYKPVAILPEVTPGCEWVLMGDGVATRKRDGTACLVRDGLPFKRYDAKKGKIPPANFLPVQPTPDPITLHWPGWLPILAHDKSNKWHTIAWSEWCTVLGQALADGTYELCGPHFQGNPESLISDGFFRHGSEVEPNAPRDFEGLRLWLASYIGEGIVFHHPDGRMVKIRRTDFGWPWPLKQALVHALGDEP